MKKVLMLSSLIVLITSCSPGKIGYRFGDWLIKKEILSYVKFYQGQQEKLDLQLDQFMDWHEKVMMPRYVSDLKYFEDQVSTANFKKENSHQIVREAFAAIKRRYVESFIPLAERVSPILSTLNDEQIQRTREIIAKKFTSRAKEEKKYTVKEMQELLKKNMERWLGPLTPEQEVWLADRLQQFVDPKVRQKRLTKRGHRRKTYLDIFDYPEEAKRTTIQLEYWEAYRQDFIKIDDEKPMIKLVSELLSLTTPEQRTHLQGELAGYRQLIQEIIE